ncbi:Cro/Cl family transcriptional regulator [Duganella sp. FT135W]|uniref:Cro/Cl family transcriptional regulator n=1 Tax=Duganella flavida TaxID=2692175 RepID=A0A6L8KGB7_9BURK|nr:YdaS family helix-turn-helix protein [Duganella flavida]MYM25757.1 Cro/Cl family transcriptional regulator [Duganella flavida]
MNLRDYLSLERGRQAVLAKAIGAHAPDVSRWADGSRPVPPERCVDIEIATDGQVTRPDLRPADWMRIWPELVPHAVASTGSKN